jgi:hypothetical protein
MEPDETTMRDRLITVASFATPLDARLAMNRLEAAGIRAALEGEATSAMAWHLTNAIGGVKLLVMERDCERAMEILDAAEDDRDPATEETVDDSRIDETDEQDWVGDERDDYEDDDEEIDDDAEDDAAEDEVEEELTSREQNADRALRGAIVGILFFPIQIYTLWLLVKVFASEERLRADKRKRAIVAAALCIPYLMLWCMFLRSMAAD